MIASVVLDRNEDGETYSILETNSDISGRKHAEVERERLLALEKTLRAEAESASRIKMIF